MSGHRDIVQAAERSLLMVHGRNGTPQEIIGLLVENQVPLLSFCQPKGQSLSRDTDVVTGSSIQNYDDALLGAVPDSEEFAHALEADRRLYQEAQGHFARFALVCEARGAPCICFKSAGIAPSYPYTSDNYDILFRPQDEDTARAVLMDLGYVELTNTDEPQKWLFRLFSGGRSVSAIHLHTRVGWGQGFMLEDEIWARRRQSKDDPVTWVPGPEDVVLINVAHAFFENKAFGLHDLMKVRQAIRDGVDWDRVDRVAEERGWLRALHFGLSMLRQLEARLFDEPMIPGTEVERIKQIVADDSNMAEQLQRASTEPPVLPFPTSWKLVKILFFEKIRLDRRVSRLSKPSLVFLTLARGLKSQAKLGPQNSGLFTLSGVDGSGKTTQAETLLEAFNVCHVRTRVTWARVGATPIMYRVSRLWRRSGGTRSDRETGRPTLMGRQGIPLMVWALMSSADFALWLFGIRWRLLRGDVVIADRYQSDFEVETRLKLWRYPWLTNALARCLSFVAAKPRAAFLLELDADTARQRATPDSGDVDPPEQISLYGQMAEKYRLIRVDAGGSYEEVSAQVIREALRSYMRSFGTLGDALFFSNPWQLNRPQRESNPPGGSDVAPSEGHRTPLPAVPTSERGL